MIAILQFFKSCENSNLEIQPANIMSHTETPLAGTQLIFKAVLRVSLAINMLYKIEEISKYLN